MGNNEAQELAAQLCESAHIISGAPHRLTGVADLMCRAADFIAHRCPVSPNHASGDSAAVDFCVNGINAMLADVYHLIKNMPDAPWPHNARKVAELHMMLATMPLYAKPSSPATAPDCPDCEGCGCPNCNGSGVAVCPACLKQYPSAHDKPPNAARKFLANGARFKLRVGANGCAQFTEFPESLIGKWVALVDATDGKHMTNTESDGWRPIESAPVGEDSMVWDEILGRARCAFQNADKRWCTSDGSYRIMPSLWQPLPAAPRAP